MNFMAMIGITQLNHKRERLFVDAHLLHYLKNWKIKTKFNLRLPYAQLKEF